MQIYTVMEKHPNGENVVGAFKTKKKANAFAKSVSENYEDIEWVVTQNGYRNESFDYIITVDKVKLL